MEETMTSLERALAVLEGRIPDRVPVCILNFPNVARVAGLSVHDYCLSGERMAEAQIAYWDEFRHDIIQIENGIGALSEAVGCKVLYPDEDPPWVTKPAIGSLDDIGKLPDVDIHRWPGCGALVRATRLVAEKLGDNVCIRGDSDLAAFSLASHILGMQDFMIALVDPDKVDQIHKLLAYANAQSAKLVRAQFAAGSHCTVIGDSTAGPDLCSPKTYRQFAKPYETSLIEEFRQEGREVGTHMCGNATPIIQDMLETTATYFEFDHKADREAIRDATDGKATIFGTVDPSNLIPRGTPEEVFAKAREDIRLLGQNGRFILGPGCALPLSTPVENVRALVEAARQHGWYGEDGRLVDGERI